VCVGGGRGVRQSHGKQIHIHPRRLHKNSQRTRLRGLHAGCVANGTPIPRPRQKKHHKTVDGRCTCTGTHTCTHTRVHVVWCRGHTGRGPTCWKHGSRSLPWWIAHTGKRPQEGQGWHGAAGESSTIHACMEKGNHMRGRGGGCMGRTTRAAVGKVQGVGCVRCWRGQQPPICVSCHQRTPAAPDRVALCTQVHTRSTARTHTHLNKGANAAATPTTAPSCTSTARKEAVALDGCPASSTMVTTGASPGMFRPSRDCRRLSPASTPSWVKPRMKRPTTGSAVVDGEGWTALLPSAGRACRRRRDGGEVGLEPTPKSEPLAPPPAPPSRVPSPNTGTGKAMPGSVSRERAGALGLSTGTVGAPGVPVVPGPGVGCKEAIRSPTDSATTRGRALAWRGTAGAKGTTGPTHSLQQHMAASSRAINPAAGGIQWL
jgi:hypothetical protein